MFELSLACLQALRIAALLALPLLMPDLFVGGALPAAAGLIPVTCEHVEEVLRASGIGRAGGGTGQLHGGLRELAFEGYGDAHPTGENFAAW